MRSTKIDGKVYYAQKTTPNRNEAFGYADRWRRHGHNARVETKEFKNGKKQYTVLVNRKNGRNGLG